MKFLYSLKANKNKLSKYQILTMSWRKWLSRRSKFSELILMPNSRDSLSSMGSKCSISLDLIIGKTTTIFIPISNKKGSKTIFLVHWELSFIPEPKSWRVLTEIFIVSLWLAHNMLVIKWSKTMETVVGPSPRITDSGVRIVQNTISLKFPLWVHFSFIKGSIFKPIFPIISNQMIIDFGFNTINKRIVFFLGHGNFHFFFLVFSFLILILSFFFLVLSFLILFHVKLLLSS